MATILVMEDDDIVRGLLVRALEMENHTVLAFSDAAPVLDGVEVEQADLIITDLTMPTPGEEAIRVLRERGIQTPILVVSGYVDEARSRHLTQLGVQDIVEKPFDLLEFLRKVNDFL